MKILHTADWHLGKKLEGKPLIEEQKRIIAEILSVVEKENIDVTVVAGDVFDTAVPTSEAEELFYDTVTQFSEKCLFVAIAGNHDDGVRLCAARSLAKKHGAVLCGDLDNQYFTGEDVVGGKGYITYRKGEETLNLALLPYPLDVMLETGDKPYSEKVAAVINTCSQCFKEGEYNLFVSHLFMSGSENEESSLGGARLLPKDVLPACHYTALGHIHKCTTVSKSKSAYYSGSILPYSFDDAAQKSVNVVTLEKTGVEVKRVELTEYQRLVRIEVTSFAEAMDSLSECKDKAEIIYRSNTPVNGLQMSALRAMPSFVKFTPRPDVEGERREQRKLLTDDALFKSFYQEKRGKQPDDQTVDLFLTALKGEDL